MTLLLEKYARGEVLELPLKPKVADDHRVKGRILPTVRRARMSFGGHVHVPSGAACLVMLTRLLRTIQPHTHATARGGGAAPGGA
jgi:hypothetical protein